MQVAFNDRYHSYDLSVTVGIVVDGLAFFVAKPGAADSASRSSYLFKGSVS